VAIALQNHIQQIISGGLRQTFFQKQIINHQKIGAAEQLEQLFALSCLRGFKDVFKEALRFPVGHLITGLDRGMRNRFGNVAFTSAGVADQKRIGGRLHKLYADQLKNLLSGETGIIRPVKILHNLSFIQPGAVKTSLNQS
jgi:hypothetical protein